MVRGTSVYGDAVFTALDPRIQTIPEAGCWIWMGAVGTGGYGYVYGHKSRSASRAHRVFWERQRGPIPEGLYLDHVCRNRLCVNPDHLRAVTPRVNALENSTCVSALNARKKECPFCGGVFTKNPAGRRECIPCRRSRSLAHYHATKGSRAKARLTPG